MKIIEHRFEPVSIDGKKRFWVTVQWYNPATDGIQKKIDSVTGKTTICPCKVMVGAVEGEDITQNVTNIINRITEACGFKADLPDMSDLPSLQQIAYQLDANCIVDHSSGFPVIRNGNEIVQGQRVQLPQITPLDDAMEKTGNPKIKQIQDIMAKDIDNLRKNYIDSLQKNVEYE